MMSARTAPTSTQTPLNAATATAPLTSWPRIVVTPYSPIPWKEKMISMNVAPVNSVATLKAK